jgi:hypothetical protein
MKYCRFLLLLFSFSSLILISCSDDEDDDVFPLPVNTRGLWFSDKFWCHRVITIERARRVENKCKGLEIDIIFSRDTLFVKHDEEDTATLTLPELMEALEDPDSHYFWFDLKNIDATNNEALSSALLSVVRTYSSIGHCVFESWMPMCMSDFVNAGCHTSFFIDLNGLNTPEEYEERVAKITQYVESYRISAISAIESVYDEMTLYFPDYNKLIWYTGTKKTYIDSLRNVVSNDVTMQVCLLEEEIFK